MKKADDKDLVDKQYSMTKVCGILNIKSHQIRYWESELDLHFARDNRNRRFFTSEDITLLSNIKNWIEVEKHSLHTIKMFLTKKGIAITQTENALQNTDIKNFTPAQFQEIMTNALEELILSREEKLIERLENKLKEQEERHQKELEELPERIRLQLECENQKLLNYIELRDQKNQKKWYEFWK